MQELIDLALDAARSAGAGYADIRITERASESLTVKNGNLAEASSNRTAGFGVRVLVDGAREQYASAIALEGATNLRFYGFDSNLQVASQ